MFPRPAVAGFSNLAPDSMGICHLILKMVLEKFQVGSGPAMSPEQCSLIILNTPSHRMFSAPQFGIKVPPKSGQMAGFV